MGSGSSFLELPEAQREEIFQEMKDLYENEYLPKVQRGELHEGEGYSVFREKLEKFLDGKNIKHDGFFKDVPDIFHNSPFAVGDVVKARDGGLMFEGVVVNFENGMVQVDFGDAVENFAPEHCSLVLSGLEFEVGDKVEYQPQNTGLHFLGSIIDINPDTLTADILMEGDDPDDIERGVSFDQMRKVKTGRELSEKLKKGIRLVQAVNRFNSMFKNSSIGGESKDISESKEDLESKDASEYKDMSENKHASSV